MGAWGESGVREMAERIGDGGGGERRCGAPGGGGIHV